MSYYPKSSIPIMTEWASFTPTGSWVSNVTYGGRWRRIGDTLYVRVSITCTGAPTSTSLTVNLPSAAVIGESSITVDTSKIQIMENTLIGHATFANPGVSYNANGFVTYATATAVSVGYCPNGTLSSVTATSPFSFGNTDTVCLYYSLPLTEWA